MFEKIKNMIKKMSGMSFSNNEEKYDDEFVWLFASALMYRDEDVSVGALPAPVKEQPNRKKYYDDAKYILLCVKEDMELFKAFK